MSAPAKCDMVLLAQAELDGELDAGQAALFRAHRAECPVCREAQAAIGQSRELLRSADLYERAPPPVRERVLARIAAESLVSPHPPRQLLASLAAWWRSAASFGLGAAIAAALTLWIVPIQGEGVTEEIVASHIRALQPGHLEDVPSSDQHTVKPWFDGRIDFAPPVKQLAAAGFPLMGGRLDYVDERPVVALVYGRDKHVIDLFVWPASGSAASPPVSDQRKGYNLVHWSVAGMRFWAVSDVEASQLRAFAEAWERSP